MNKQKRKLAKNSPEIVEETNNFDNLFQKTFRKYLPSILKIYWLK